MDQENASEAQSGWKPKLGVIIGVVLASAVLFSSVAIIVVAIVNYRSTVLGVSHSLMVQLAERAQERVQAFAQPSREVTETLRVRLEEGLTPIGDIDRLEVELFSLMKVFEGVDALNYGDDQGRFVMTWRQPDGSVSSKLIWREGESRRVTWRHRTPSASVSQVKEEVEAPDDQYDPRGRPWYIGAAQLKQAFLSEVYVFWSSRQPGFTFSQPLLDGEDVRGVVSADKRLQSFSVFLRRLELGRTGRAMIVDSKGRLIASPDAKEAVLDAGTNADALPTLRLLSQSHDPAFASLAGEASFQALLKGDVDTTTLNFDVDGESFVAVVRPIHLESDRDWLIVIAIPEDELLEDVRATGLETLLIASVLVALALLFSVLLARWINRSLGVLARQSERIRQLDFTNDTSTRSVPFREVDEVVRAFERMKVGLRGFQRYLPVELVRYLLEKNQEPVLGGDLREVTIHFSDMVDFTSLSERHAPMEMAEILGSYLASLSEEIRETGGTVVQYVGDEIMAFWNAPRSVEAHARQACLSALACLETGKRLEAAGLPLMKTRVGLHTTEVAVGHFGAPDRLYYGAIGDGVNLTSRLEGANKFYGTRIIISHETWKHIHTEFETRRLDHVMVKGKHNACFIYELLGPRGAVDAARLERARLFEAGFDHYQAQRFEEAIEQLGHAHLEADKAAQSLIARCRQFLLTPPPGDWDGAFALTQK